MVERRIIRKRHKFPSSYKIKLKKFINQILKKKKINREEIIILVPGCGLGRLPFEFFKRYH